MNIIPQEGVSLKLNVTSLPDGRNIISIVIPIQGEAGDKHALTLSFNKDDCARFVQSLCQAMDKVNELDALSEVKEAAND